MSTAALEVLECARYGEHDELRALLLQTVATSPDEIDALVNFAQDGSKNTPLHMACANGHAECARVLVEHGARHVANASGNYPLHWAVQNRHLACVRVLLECVTDIDVLAQNGFGRGSVTEAFQSDDPAILSALLEHTSATEERLVAGSMMDNAKIREENDDDDDNADATDASPAPKIIQETVLEFSFDASLPIVKARELALDWTKDAFGTTAADDITGVSIWSASLLLSRWVVDHLELFANKQVCELGAGCGVSGLAVYKFTTAKRVVLSDLFDHTLANLRHNVALNQSTSAIESDSCAKCSVAQRFGPDNPDGKLLKCGGCRVVAYCSRACQKAAWKRHKLECKQLRAQADRTLEVAAIDWQQPVTWPSPAHPFDILIGSDLVYHEEIVDALVDVVDGLVAKDNGTFVHVASQSRHSLDAFSAAMATRGFACEVNVVPESYKTNPLVGDDAAVELFHLHFNEMSDVYCTYVFTRRSADAAIAAAVTAIE